jgi:hypothetical protein
MRKFYEDESMKILISILLFAATLYAAEFSNANELVKAYKEYGFDIRGDVKIDMFRRLSEFYDEVQKKLRKTEEKRGVLSFIDPELKTKIFVHDGVVNIQIPETTNAEIVFSQFMRIDKINRFLVKNQIKSVFEEANFHSFEQFIKIFNENNHFTGTSLDVIEFKNVLYPMVSIRAKSKIVLTLPFGNAFLYWEKVISKVKDDDFKDNLKKLAKEISDRSQLRYGVVYKTILYNRGVIADPMKEKTVIGRTKFRSKLIRLLAREFPPKVLPQEVVKSLENVPYRYKVRAKKKKELMTHLSTVGGLKNVKLELAYLTPLRVVTIRKVVEVLKVNRDLKNINLNLISFNNKQSKPTVKREKKNKAYRLILSDYVTQNNIYSVLKTVPLK